ncbi:hypothetical protein [Aureispira anguillae]|uniref:Uncharacterized protein n=1 Tax=Aureispira anguillae TaxID=2864201 RepID=A0A915YJK7_9BACT|nr:hypothetical protein [Aureispira anguillae]BDS14146.1 hypothetical protein AsAng_0049180 [Aureispira anguillae]
MKFFDYIKKTLSPSCCEQGEQVSKEPLKRSDDYCIQYGKWLKLNKHQDMLKTIYEASTKRTGCSSQKDKSICFLMIPTINGFTMHYDAQRWEQQDFRYLLEYIAQLLIQNQGYEQLSSMKETIQYANRKEVVERYKLKSCHPETAYSDILIRLCYTNNQITSLKFCATCAKNKKPNLSDLLQKIAGL